MSDGVISNNRPDTAKTLGIDYDSLSAINPAIIYVDITAYGMKGPLGGAPGFDLVMQGFTAPLPRKARSQKTASPRSYGRPPTSTSPRHTAQPWA